MMENSFVLFGQLFGVFFFAVLILLFVLIPISLRKIAQELAEIKVELRAKNEQQSQET